MAIEYGAPNDLCSTIVKRNILRKKEGGGLALIEVEGWARSRDSISRAYFLGKDTSKDCGYESSDAAAKVGAIRK